MNLFRAAWIQWLLRQANVMCDGAGHFCHFHQIIPNYTTGHSSIRKAICIHCIFEMHFSENVQIMSNETNLKWKL